jgi:hypothetical protein
MGWRHAEIQRAEALSPCRLIFDSSKEQTRTVRNRTLGEIRTFFQLVILLGHGTMSALLKGCIPMTETDDFWSGLHQLAETYERRGLTADERLQEVLNSFRDQPPTVRRQLLADVFRLSMDLPDLYAAIAAAGNSSEERSAFFPGQVG